MSDFMIRNFYKQRKDFEKSSAERNLTLTFPDTVTEIKNIPYMTDGSAAKDNTSLDTDFPLQSSKSHICDSHRLDCYRPKKQDGELLPVIVNVHGGGLLLGSKEFNRLFCMRLSELGFLVYSVEYRLIPDCSFFDQCQDLACAMDFLKTRISSDNGDLSHVYAVGDSGGACLLTYTAALQQQKLPKSLRLLYISMRWDSSVACFIQQKRIKSGCFFQSIFTERITKRVPLRRL